MLVKVFGSAVYGVEAITITIEVDIIGGGLTGYFIVGLPDNAIKESTERVLSAIKNTGYERPRNKVVVNMAGRILSFYDKVNASISLLLTSIYV